MIAEFIGVVASLAGGLAGVLGETRAKKTGRLTCWGWVSLSVVIIAACLGLTQAYRGWVADSERAQQESVAGYEALMGVYGPLSQWLEDTAQHSPTTSKSVEFPPNLGLDIYAKFQGHPDIAQGVVSRLTSITRPDGKSNYSALASWGAKYDLAREGLNPSIANGFGLPEAVRENLRDLSKHSLFRGASENDARARVSGRRCQGSISALAAEISNPDTPPMWRDRCIVILTHELSLAFKDPAPVPPLAPDMKAAHIQACQRSGYRYPYCIAETFRH